MSHEFQPQKASRLTQSTHLISGLLVTLHYNNVLSNPIDSTLSSDSKILKVFIFLHGLGQSEATHSNPLAESVLHHYYPLAVDLKDGGVEPLIIVTFDHRNHGARLIDASRHKNWDGGNEMHALDLFGYIDGAIADLKLIREMLPLHFPLLNEFEVKWVIGGVSMGGHTTIRFASQYPELIDGALPIVGGFDLSSLIVDRLNHEAEDKVYEKCYEDLLKAGKIDQKRYPKTLFLKTAKDDARIYHNYDTTSHRLKTFALFGEDDPVVVTKYSLPFLEKVGEVPVQRDQLSKEKIFQAVSYGGVKHQVTEEMVEDITKWIVEF